ncbi:hypothetical protein PVK06_040017 [Gossypium arboreum]|uniref:Uncharacterized protein n=1 Tax=Gossypium arboreum TaxID=29729 RepID=A0ABR0N4C5_GOSAR|nr:hypothetical protein PVK06_040017 [Gossypium arboreum]
MLQYVNCVQPYLKEVAFEFYANLFKILFELRSKLEHKAYAKEMYYNFDIIKIRKLLVHPCASDVEHDDSFDSIGKLFTNEVHLTWPLAAKILASTLKPTYDSLFSIATKNQIPIFQSNIVTKKMATLPRRLYFKNHEAC